MTKLNTNNFSTRKSLEELPFEFRTRAQVHLSTQPCTERVFARKVNRLKGKVSDLKVYLGKLPENYGELLKVMKKSETTRKSVNHDK